MSAINKPTEVQMRLLSRIKQNVVGWFTWGDLINAHIFERNMESQCHKLVKHGFLESKFEKGIWSNIQFKVKEETT